MGDLDVYKPLATIDGRSVRFLCMDNKNDDLPIVGFIIEDDGGEVLARWSATGVSDIGVHADLTNIPPPEPYTLIVDEDDSYDAQSISSKTMCTIEVIPERKCVIIKSFNDTEIIVEGVVKQIMQPSNPNNGLDLLGGYLKSLNGKLFDRDIEL